MFVKILVENITFTKMAVRDPLLRSAHPTTLKLGMYKLELLTQLSCWNTRPVSSLGSEQLAPEVVYIDPDPVNALFCPSKDSPLQTRKSGLQRIRAA